VSYASDTKRLRMYTDNRVKCKCGHSHFMPVFLQYKICGWCGNIVFRNENEEFKYKLKRQIRRQK
jgi:ribosomal protein S27AE